MRFSSKHIAWLCLLLTLGLGVAFAAHHHSSAIETAKCPVCVAAHSATPQAVASIVKATFVRTFLVHAEPVSVHKRFIAFALRVRPPPSV